MPGKHQHDILVHGKDDIIAGQFLEKGEIELVDRFIPAIPGIPCKSIPGAGNRLKVNVVPSQGANNCKTDMIVTVCRYNRSHAPLTLDFFADKSWLSLTYLLLCILFTIEENGGQAREFT